MIAFDRLGPLRLRPIEVDEEVGITDSLSVVAAKTPQKPARDKIKYNKQVKVSGNIPVLGADMKTQPLAS